MSRSKLTFNFWLWIVILVEFISQVPPSSSFTYQNRGGGGITTSINGAAINSASRDRQGCFWVVKSSPSSSNVSDLLTRNNGVTEETLLECHVRTLNVDFLNLNSSVQNQQQGQQGTGQGRGQQLTRQDLDKAHSLRVKCNEKLFFDSLLVPNQTILFSLVNLRQVEVESCKIRRIPGNVWTSLSFLKSLSIRTKNGDWSTSVSLEVENEAFEGLSQLSYLDISFNNIYSLPERTFCPLRNLAKLNVSHNSLTELEELNWNERENYCMLGVQNVDLSFNSIRRIGKIFKWKKITELYLHKNYIEELDDMAFAELLQLKLVNLSSNRLVALPPTIFKSNKNIREIYLANNSISALAPAVFSGLDQLVLLDLSRNTLTSQWIHDKMFHGLNRLVVLRLSFNQLSYVDSSIFHDLISLQALNLDNNRIETVSPEAFLSLSNLQVLDLSKNRITSLDSRLFSHLFLLRQLYLDHNKIRIVDDHLLSNCTNLQDLGLADNLLLEVPVALKAAIRMQTLDIGENRIASLTNDSFEGLGQLFGLRIVDNRLTELPRGFCDPLKKLRVLNLAQNRLYKISSSAFTSCPELRALRLDTNALEELPSSLVPQLPSLLWLNVSVNFLHAVDYRSLPRTVEWLDLSHNSIESIGGLGAVEATSNMQLRILDLSYNKLAHLDHQTIPGTLETLRVNHNKLTNVQPDTFIRSNSLRRVELVGNLLETLPLTALRFPPIPGGRSLPEFYLSSNPFRCDCSMELTRVNQLSLLRQHPRIMDLDSITCSTVFSRNQTVIKLRDSRTDQFLCSYKSHCFALCHCCEFEFCDCAMTCPSNCTCYHDVAWSRNIVDCSNGHHQDIPQRIPMDVTELYLDGNEIPSLSSHIFIGKKHARALFLNNSRVEFIRNKTFNGLKSLEILHLGENLLTEVQGFEFIDMENLKELHLQNNLLKFIAPDSFNSLKSLEILRLHGNHLMSFNVWELSVGSGSALATPTSTTSTNGGLVNLKSLTLSENPWSCNCEFIIAFRAWIFSHSNLISDLTLMTCRIVANKTATTTTTSGDMDLVAKQLTATASISTICHGPSERLVNFNNNNNIGGSVGGDMSVGGNFDRILSDEHQVNVNQISGSGSKVKTSQNQVEGDGGNDFSSIMTVDQDDDDQEDSDSDSDSVQRRPTELSNMRSGNDKSSGGSNTSSIEDEADSGVFWTLLLTCGGFAILLLLLLILFRHEIYERLNDKVNMFLLCTSCCGTCCHPRGGRTSSHGKSKKSSHSSHHGVGSGASLSGGGSGGGINSVSDETEKLFDAYFLYSKKDEDLLLEKLTPELEHGIPNFFRLCLHYRDLCLNPQNPWNHDMIQSACDSSKRVILILSQNLLQSEWQNSVECRSSLQFVMSRPDIQKKLIIILLPPLTINQQNLANLLFSNHIPPNTCSSSSSSNISVSATANAAYPNMYPPPTVIHNIMNNKLTSLLKSSTLEWTDRNFWSKFKLLLPTPIHSSISADHPMLIPATYTISRQHGGDYHSHHHHPHGSLKQDRQPPTNDFNRTLDYQRQLANTNLTFNSRNPLIPPSYDQSSPPSSGSSLPLSFLNYANTNMSTEGSRSHNIPLSSPHHPPQLWQTGLKENPVNIIQSQIGMTNSNRAIHPIPSQHMSSFNESFRRYQQAHLDQHQQQQQQQQQALRLANKKSSSVNPNSRHHQHNNNNMRSHQHQHQDSNCSNISNNSRRPLNASPGYSSSVETNISSSNEELDHVYSTLDSPLPSPSLHHNHNHNHHHSNKCCAHLNSNNSNSNSNDSGVVGSNNECSIKLNPYSPTNINNNGDPTMYFV